MIGAFIVTQLGEFILDRVFGNIYPRFEKMSVDDIHIGEFETLTAVVSRGGVCTMTNIYASGKLNRIIGGKASIEYSGIVSIARYNHEDDYRDAVDSIKDGFINVQFSESNKTVTTKHAKAGTELISLDKIERIKYS